MRPLKRRRARLALGRRPVCDGASPRRPLRSLILLAILSMTLVLVPIAPAAGAAGTGQAMVVLTVASRPTLSYGSRGTHVT
jgi:hypothetical protein